MSAGGMTRGNQREIDRARAAKRTGGVQTQKEKDGLTPEQRRERYCMHRSPCFWYQLQLMLHIQEA